MTHQVLTISPDGGLSGLQVKKGRGLDLRSFGHASIERVSEIKWDAENQFWFVQVIAGPFAGRRLCDDLWKTYVGDEGPANAELARTLTEGGGRLYAFDEYEDGVEAEIAFLDAARKRGTF